MLKIMGMKEKFNVVESEINWPLTYLGVSLIWLVTVSVLVTVFFLFYEILDYGFADYLNDKPSDFFILLFAGVSLIVCCAFLIFLMLNYKKKYFRKTIINEKGASVYNIKNEIVAQTLYAQLCHSNDVYFPDISHTIHNQPNFRIVLRVFKKDENNTVTEQSVDFNYNYLSVKNKRELYRHFLIGIQTFRPELKIGQRTMENYHLKS